MLYFQKAAKLLINRALSTSASSQHVLEHLSNRTLIRVSGQEVSDFLQGLITNNMKHLSNGPGSMYAMFLNNKGRVLYDTIIYRLMENNTYFVECNKQVSKALEKHLMMYRVRRKIDIINVDSEFKVYALFSEKPGDGSKAVNSKAHKNLLLFRDPRTASLGTRVLSKADANVRQELSEVTAVNFESPISYRYLRYRLGVGEGVEDLPPGNCFPLESNCDYLHGVSFDKGCYIGQELTARVHHTGVIRKRLLPIQFSKVPSKSPEEKIVHENVNLGKLKGVENDYGLGLLRLTSLDFNDIKIGDGVGNVRKPSWWPVELSKEKVSLQKNQ